MADTPLRTVLVTGVTGTLGAGYVKFLSAQGNVQLVLLVRAASDDAARARVEEQMELPRGTEVYSADLSLPELGLKPVTYQHLAQTVTHILHSAANTKFILPLESARAHNVETTRNMLDFATKCTGLRRFAHVSTALVAGKRTGVITEDEFEHSHGFTNTYQHSKYEAEALVRSYVGSLPVVILRPPFVISKPPTKYKGPTSLLSHLLKIIKRGYLPLSPGHPENTFDMVSGDEVAEHIVALLLKEQLQFLTYHISNFNNALTVGRVKELFESHIGEPIQVKFCGDVRKFKRHVLYRSLFNPALWFVYKKATSYLQEAAYPKVYDNTHLLTELNLSTLHSEPEKVFSTMLEW